MASTSSVARPSTSGERVRRGAFLALRILLSLAFVGTAAFKLSGNAAAVAEFDHVDLGQGFRYFTAATEPTGAVLLLLPSTILFGALLMGAVCVGAFVAQAFALHGDVVHTVVMAAIFGAIAWFHRGQIRGRR